MPGTRPAVLQRPHGRLAVERVELPLTQLVVVLCPWQQCWPPPPQEMLDHPVGRAPTVANPQEGATVAWLCRAALKHLPRHYP